MKVNRRSLSRILIFSSFIFLMWTTICLKQMMKARRACSGFALLGDTSLELTLARCDDEDSNIRVGGPDYHFLDEVSVPGTNKMPNLAQAIANFLRQRPFWPKIWWCAPTWTGLAVAVPEAVDEMMMLVSHLEVLVNEEKIGEGRISKWLWYMTLKIWQRQIYSSFLDPNFFW